MRSRRNGRLQAPDFRLQKMSVGRTLSWRFVCSPEATDAAVAEIQGEEDELSLPNSVACSPKPHSLLHVRTADPGRFRHCSLGRYLSRGRVGTSRRALPRSL